MPGVRGCGGGGVDMTRRTVLRSLLVGAAAAAAALWAPVSSALRAAAHRAPCRTSPGLLSRLRGKTRPLDPARLRDPHELAG